jgi:replication-associated recombination protein RarA
VEALTRHSQFHVLHLFGPGGVGKTSLLGEFAILCEQAGVPAYYLDGRNVEPSPDGFNTALRAAMELDPAASPLTALAAPSRHHVILIDTCETLAPFDGWLRDTFLPQLPENMLVVLPAPADDAHLISASAKAKRAEHCHPRPIS